MNIDLQDPQSINYLKSLMASGQITPEDLQNVSSPDADQNALSQMFRSRGAQFVRNEDSGQTQFMGQPQAQPQMQPQGPYQSTPQLGPQVMGNQAPQGQMRVVGAGNGVTMDLGTQPYQPVPLDSRRGQIDIPGVGRGDYGQDGNAYVKNPDGSMTKVLLGYDAPGSMALNRQNLANQKTQADIAHTQEEIRASRAQNPDLGSLDTAFGPQTSPDSSGGQLKGEELMKQLEQQNPSMAETVRSYIEGRMPVPQGFALKSPYFQYIMRVANLVDPSFSAADYPSRLKTRNAFTSGPMAQTVKNANQALHHADLLDQNITDLNNFNGLATPLNAPVNFVEKAFGNPNPGTFQQTALALSSELRKLFASSGGGGLTELQNWESSFPVNASQEQQRKYLDNGMDLLNGAMQALNAQYQRGMGPRGNIGDLLSADAKQALTRLSKRYANGVELSNTLGVATPTNAVGAQAPGMLPVQGQPQGQNSIPPAAVAYLKQNPGMRVAFDMKYGQGASAQVLGQ